MVGMNAHGTPRLFEVFGVELEYMIVDARTLAVRPVADRLLEAAAGRVVGEVDCGGISWSNELALHVFELKVTQPAEALEALPEHFQQQVQRANQLLQPLGARLMPGGMHPWMDPVRETVLWPHEYHQVYAAFDRIFNCRRHGWANLQSVHLNLPFCGDEEFAQLHAAIRLLMPLMPALAASSPFMEGRAAGWLDTRLHVYAGNSEVLPQATGRVIPEAVYRRADYQDTILRPLYEAIAPHDPLGELQDEWLNARGAIARFCRSTLEIRVLDVQECPRADLAVAAAIVEVLKALVGQRWTSSARQQAWPVAPLRRLLDAVMRDAEAAQIDDMEYLAVFGLSGEPRTAGEVWRHLIETLVYPQEPLRRAWQEPLERILQEGPLARRLLRSAGGSPTPARLREVYGDLCDCLAEGRLYRAAP